MIETLAAATVAPVVLMNDEERQVDFHGCALLMDLCVEERRLLGGTSVDELVKWGPSNLKVQTYLLPVGR